MTPVESITIFGGRARDGTIEPVGEFTIQMGEIASVVGPTGSGKTALINDIELFADGNTPTGRRVLINGSPAPVEYMDDPSRNPIALITQHTNFLSDLPVRRFLETHARIRLGGSKGSVVEETLGFANELTGEPIIPGCAMTELSGGQTRALLIADAVIIGNSSILLLDEIENAGIHRTRALELLRGYRKIFIFVTHDPRIALLSDFRIVMGGGAMKSLIPTDEEEKKVVEGIKRLDDLMFSLRKKIWSGGKLRKSDLLS